MGGKGKDKKVDLKGSQFSGYLADEPIYDDNGRNGDEIRQGALNSNPDAVRKAGDKYVEFSEQFGGQPGNSNTDLLHFLYDFGVRLEQAWGGYRTAAPIAQTHLSWLFEGAQNMIETSRKLGNALRDHSDTLKPVKGYFEHHDTTWNPGTWFSKTTSDFYDDVNDAAEKRDGTDRVVQVDTDGDPNKPITYKILSSAGEQVSENQLPSAQIQPYVNIVNQKAQAKLKPHIDATKNNQYSQIPPYFNATFPPDVLPLRPDDQLHDPHKHSHHDPGSPGDNKHPNPADNKYPNPNVNPYVSPNGNPPVTGGPNGPGSYHPNTRIPTTTTPGTQSPGGTDLANTPTSTTHAPGTTTPSIGTGPNGPTNNPSVPDTTTPSTITPTTFGQDPTTGSGPRTSTGGLRGITGIGRSGSPGSTDPITGGRSTVGGSTGGAATEGPGGVNGGQAGAAAEEAAATNAATAGAARAGQGMGMAPMPMGGMGAGQSGNQEHTSQAWLDEDRDLLHPHVDATPGVIDHHAADEV